MKVIFSIIILIAIAGGYSWFKTQPTAMCKSSKTSTPYCKYNGNITKVYLNAQGLVLVYLNADFSTKSAKEYGYNVGSGSIVSLNIIENKADLHLYQTILFAMDEELAVELHARNTLSGYMKLDRIWLEQ